MKHATILILCVGLAATAACRPEQVTRDKSGGASSAGGEPTAMTPTSGSPGARPAPMDFSLPSGDPPHEPPRAAPPISAKPGVLKAALADLDRIQIRQKQVVKLWQSLNTVAEAKKHRQAMITGALDVLRMTISSMRKAMTLSEAGLATFLQKQRSQRAEAQKMNEIIKAKQRQLTALPGGKAFYEELKQSATAEVQKHSETLLLLGRQLLRRQKELKP